MFKKWIVVMCLLLFVALMPAVSGDEDIFIEKDILINPSSLEFTVCIENPEEWHWESFTITNLGPNTYYFEIEPWFGAAGGPVEDPHNGIIGPYQTSIPIGIHVKYPDETTLNVGDFNTYISVIVSNWNDEHQFPTDYYVIYDMPVVIHHISCAQEVPEFPLLILPIGIIIGLVLTVFFLKKGENDKK